MRYHRTGLYPHKKENDKTQCFKKLFHGAALLKTNGFIRGRDCFNLSRDAQTVNNKTRREGKTPNLRVLLKSGTLRPSRGADGRCFL